MDNSRNGVDALYRYELSDGSKLTIGNRTYIFCNRPSGANDFTSTLGNCDSTICD